jgi:SAM-dependent methyltransferase
VDAIEQERMKRMEEEYWWHVGRRYLIRRTLEHYLGSEGSLDVLDVGCGSGRNLRLLEQFGNVRGVEPEGPGLEACRADGLDNVVAGSADAIPFDDGSFDLVTSLDVLEHLDDDDAGLQEIHRVLRPSGYALITVPAYRFLWSVHDEALGHRRRYVASEVHSLLNNNGFVVVRRTYAISFALPAILGYRIAQGLFPPLHERGASYVEVGAVPNWLLTQALKIESRLLGRVDLPVGASILALARKA